MNPFSTTRSLWFFVAAIVAISILVVAWVMRRPAEQSLDPNDVSRLIELKNRAIGDLENIPNRSNNDGSGSVEAFSELEQLLPEEPIGLRNLAITWIVILENLDRNKTPEKFADAVEQGQAVLARLKRRKPDSVVPHLLAAKWAKVLGDRQLAVSEYRLATQNRPEDFVPWAQLLMCQREGGDDVSTQEALQHAYAARPSNVVLLEYWIREQTDSQSENIVELLNDARRSLQPFVTALENQGIKLDEELDAFAARFEKGDDTAWKDTKFRMTQIFNVIRPEMIYQMDLAELDRHVLDYVIHDFSEKFYENVPSYDSAKVKDNQVRLVALTENEQQWPEFTDVVDVALCDFDLDGQSDAVVLREKTIVIFALDEEKRHWKQIVEKEIPAGMDHLLVADFDRDTVQTPTAACQLSDLDLLVYGSGGYIVFENHQDDSAEKRSLLQVKSPLALEPTTGILAANVADVDHDGDLDLIIANNSGISIWSNRENWTFVETTGRSIMPQDEMAHGLAITPVDWNRDVLIDILIGIHGAPAGRLENVRHGRFRWREYGTEMCPESANALVAIDADSNGSWDLLSCNDQGVMLTLTRTREGDSVSALQSNVLTTEPTTGVTPWDYDNDGTLDLITWGATGTQVFRGLSRGRFAQAPPTVTPMVKSVKSCDVGDIDQDGDLDLVVVADRRAHLFRNDGGNQNHWIDIHLSAEPDPKDKIHRTNLYGIGSLVELRAGTTYQAQTVRGQVVHFGLGDRERADAVRVLWTNGIPQNVVAPETNQTICEKQRLLKGSCPYLYTWTGKKFEFFTDLLWAAPIGLQLAEGVLAPAREEEYLLIPGDRLVAEDGKYRLQITEELWEAAYFDTVQLFAIDHPADIAVFSNEKVGPPEVSKYGIHTIRKTVLAPPVAARDSQGRDVLPWINQVDGQYLKLFDQRLKQGLTDEQILEIELGIVGQPTSIKLVLTGWVFPTDTSINVAISQNPQLAPPQPPSVWVPSREGFDEPIAQPSTKQPMRHWKQVIPHMGFPGGKTKTIVVDLPVTEFANGDYRVRIMTSMELYWDAIQVAVDAPQSEFARTQLELLGADLHYRGCSARHPGRDNGPEVYDYGEVTTDPVWPPMAGNFTRYGNVKELIADHDDRLVVLGAGDEMTLRFRELPVPPPGWQRDYILHNVGWDKDADLNTVSGHRVEPLPHRRMSNYPPELNDIPPDSAEYHAYIRDYQIREQDPRRFWGQLRRPVSLKR